MNRPKGDATLASGAGAGRARPGSVAAAFARDGAGGAELEILVQPRSSRSRVVGEHEGRLKIQLAAPPVNGEANAALVVFLAEALHVRRADVVLLTGETGRRKRVRIAGVSAAAAAAALLAIASRTAGGA